MEGETPAEDDDFDDYDDEYESFQGAGEETGVQLGTVLALEGSLADSVLFKNVDWHDWDGGKAGGWPVRYSIVKDVRLLASVGVCIVFLCWRSSAVLLL